MGKRIKAWFLVTLVAGIGAAVVAWVRRGAQPGPSAFRANEKARVFHRPGCRFYDSAGSTTEFRRREEAVGAGFSPCKVCKP